MGRPFLAVRLKSIADLIEQGREVLSLLKVRFEGVFQLCGNPA